MRLFVAVAFDSAAKAKISELCNTMRRAGAAGNFTPTDNLHLTLKFLGDVASARVAAVKAALDSAALTAAPFSIKSGRCGFFVSHGEKTVWMGLAGGGLAALNSLAGAVDLAYCKAGFERERRAFTPHVTLARRAVCSADILSRVDVPEFEFIINSATLFESRRDAGRLWYKPVYVAKLGVR